MTAALDVAWFFVDKGAEARVQNVTQLIAQKLTYYAQGYALGAYGQALFDDPIQAWELGPVVLPLRAFKKYGSDPILAKERFGEVIQNKKTLVLLNSVWRAYGGFSADMLVAMTHTDLPWNEAYQKGAGSVISHESMQKYFKDRVHDLNLCTDAGQAEEPVATVFLKDGGTEKMPVSCVDEYLVAQEAHLEPRRLSIQQRKRIS